MKVCVKCKIEKPLAEFGKTNRRDINYLNSECKQCIRNRNKARYETNRAIIDSLKAVPCVDCGNCYPPECMDFDHVKGKSFSISDKMTINIKILLEEVDKCEIICANCHRIRSKARNQTDKNQIWQKQEKY